MINEVSKRSIKLEAYPEDDERDLDVVDRLFYEGLELLSIRDDKLLEKFFTIRFDQMHDGGIAATISAANKRKGQQ